MKLIGGILLHVSFLFTSKDEGTILQNATGTNDFLKVVPLKLAISLCPWARHSHFKPRTFLL